MEKKLLTRIFSLLLCVVFVFSFTGCSGKGDGSETSGEDVIAGNNIFDDELDSEKSTSGKNQNNVTGNSQGNASNGNQNQTGNSSSGTSVPEVKDMKGRTFTFCAPSWDVVDVDDAYVKALERKYNCKIKNLQLSDYTSLYTSILSGTPIADVVIMPESKFYVYAQKKLLKNLSTVKTLNPEDDSLYITAHHKNFKIDGNYYGLSIDSYGIQRLLVYNRSIIKGEDDLQTLSNQNKLTWDKLREILQKAVKNGKQGIAGMMQETDVLSTLIHANNCRVFARDNLEFTYSLESNNTRNAISYAQSLYAGGMVMANNGGNYLYPQTQFARGNVAMMIANSWNLNYIYEHAKFDIGIIMFPGGPDSSGPLVDQTEFSAYTIPSSAKNPDDIGTILTAWAIEAAKNENNRSKQSFIKYWEDILGSGDNLNVIKNYASKIDKGEYYIDFENAITDFYDDGLYALYNQVLKGEVSAQSYLESVGNIYKSKAKDFK